MKKIIVRGFLSFLAVSFVFSLLLLGSPQKAFAAFDTYSAKTPVRFFSGIWQGHRIRIWNVRNVTVEKLPDARKVGVLRDFIAREPHTARPPFYLLNGETINVWVAPRQFPGKYVVHNGMQGTQKTYGTWVFAMNRPPVRFFSGIWQGHRIRIWNVRNVTVEKLPDARKVGVLRDFIAREPHTARPPFYLLNGETINVWVAPHEFPGKYVVHNGMQGTQKTYGTWVFRK